MDKVCPLSSHTYLSCNQIFSIWRESKCCNCFPKTEKRTLRNFSNMWFHFITSRLGSQLGWTGKRLKITHNSLTQWFSLTRGLTLAMGIPCCPSLKQHAYSTRKAPKVEVHPCAFIPGPCPSPGFNNKVIVLGGEKKKVRYHGVLLRSPPCHAYQQFLMGPQCLWGGTSSAIAPHIRRSWSQTGRQALPKVALTAGI